MKKKIIIYSLAFVVIAGLSSVGTANAKNSGRETNKAVRNSSGKIQSRTFNSRNSLSDIFGNASSRMNANRNNSANLFGNLFGGNGSFGTDQQDWWYGSGADYDQGEVPCGNSTGYQNLNNDDLYYGNSGDQHHNGINGNGNNSQTNNNSDTTTNDATLAEMESQVIDLINQYRQSNGLSSLAANETIAAQARQHSADMSNKTVAVGHDGFNTRVETLTSEIGGSGFAENVAYNSGYADPVQNAYNGWLNSAGHKKNIMGDYSLTGVGVTRDQSGGYYFTQIFVK